ncbi:Golgi-specific brefeldin A-resistance guanine nucleotide exchange factor 1 [Cimex lectularius]|uniref:SEC7 domain-containing protein n=1 Tax=Cimex lectularius TaxID=79782 RepID=A0A8I6RE08_CIMLE|nr:Golgi-specific brefeldin A-resistance guanine nucleotide exchange factor 1 [Cimex lectularius]
MASVVGRMSCPGNGIYVVQGEMSMLLTAMKKVNRWSSHNHQDEENDILVRGFVDLKEVLNQIGDLRELEPNSFLNPFLEVIRSEETTSPVTSIALSSVNKFLSYGLIDPQCKTIAATVENIADAVNHAKFVGTDQTSDAIVLIKILQVLRTLMLSPEGAWLTNESVCEILLSCFRISFEVRINELLRRCAENCLRDMVQLLFTRLPTFAEDFRRNNNVQQKLQIQSNAMETSRGKRKNRNHPKPRQKKIEERNNIHSDIKLKDLHLTSTIHRDNSDIPDLQGEMQSTVTSPVSPPPSVLSSPTTENLPELPVDEDKNVHEADIEAPNILPEVKQDPIPCTDGVVIRIEDSSSNSGEPQEMPPDHDVQLDSDVPFPLEEVQVNESILEEEPLQVPPNEPSLLLKQSAEEIDSQNIPNSLTDPQEWVNQQGVRFTVAEQEDSPLPGPYGLVSVHELLRFLASLCNPQDKQNTDFMIHMGLTLIMIALEVGADNIAKYPSLMVIVKDDICRNLFSLLNSERLAVFASVLQICFLLFESLRTHLKYQLEHYLLKLIEIIVSDSVKASYEHREIALESLVQLWRIPGLVTELYLNYDCALYCPNLYEELTNLLSKNAFPVSGIHNTHLLSLDALLTVIDSIENHCNSRILNEHQQSEKGVTADGFKGITVMHNSNYILSSGTRQKLSCNIPSHEHLMAVKRRKKLLATGTEHFNSKPKKGISFLQEHNLMSNPLDPHEVVVFLRENPHLDKKMIGEYISNRANLAVLDCFVKSFDFSDLRIDEALRYYLETFRLPGESPLISLVMEHFAEHWHKCNGEPFANADAAFTLAYAVIMLNVDQHNHNVKRQNNPMTAEEFKRNLKKLNGDKDFDEEMLDEIYNSIKSDEIVMPTEQTGLVKENYLWKVLLRRGTGKDGEYVHAPNGLLDHDLFSLIWGPTVTALSSLFDKATDPAIYQKAISGFRKCAMISAHYGMSNDFDNLIVSLCKFTTLHYKVESYEMLTIMFGENQKARLAAKTVFNLAHRHGDIIRDSWRNILECILQLYKCKLLPKILVEAEDFIELSGKISLIREEIQLHPKTETGIFSSLYSYMLLGSEQSIQKGPSPEDQEAIRMAQNCIRECNLEQLITESKFLRMDSLQYFVKALVTASYGPEGHVSLGSSYSEDTAIFFLELLLKVVLQNKDRIGPMWSTVKEHIYTLLMGAAACDHHFLVERSVVGLLRLAIRLMVREEMSPMVLQSLRMLLLLKGTTLSRVARQVSYGMFELIKSSAANIHSATDWAIIFTLLECVGAGAPPPRVVSKPLNESGARSEGEVQVDSGLGNERGYTSDSELSKAGSLPLSPTISPDAPLNTSTGWILVGREGEIQPISLGNRVPPNDFSMTDKEFMCHDPYAMVKCCESLVFLVRDVVHITPYNFQNCVHCLRTFVEAAAEAIERKHFKRLKEPNLSHGNKPTRKKVGLKRKEERAKSPTGNAYDADESDPEDTPGYQQVCILLLDLMHTIHIRTAQIFKWWAEETSETEHISLWLHAWCPLLQGIARLSSHPNRQIRMSAITYLQRALLVPDLQNLTGEEWESCFTQVLFPLLSKLLEPVPTSDGLEETRIRAATVLSKVFLHHLPQLQTLDSFAQLWLKILDYKDKYMHADNSDLLLEAIPESLKNLLLVMDSTGVFTGQDGRNEIWMITWDKINSFLPNLHNELFKPVRPEEPKSNDTQSPEVPKESQQNIPFSPQEPVPMSVPPMMTTVNQQPLQTLPRPGEIVEISGPTTSLLSPQNWQPPAPIFPHMGQPISTPIGPSISSQVGTSATKSVGPVLQAPIILPTTSPIPVYSGFSNIPHQAPPPSAHFFYQDIEAVHHYYSPI